MITGFPSKTSNSHIKIYKETLKSQEWLNDKHISAAQCLLHVKKQHPDMSGLEAQTLQ